MKKELWDNVAELLDEKFADEAAEYFAKHGTTSPAADKEDYGETAAPVKLSTSPKKRSKKPYIAVAAAAAAVVMCVFTGKQLLDNDPIGPVNDPTTEETSETSETAETDETSDAVDEEEISRTIAQMFIETHLENEDGSLLDTMYVQAERLSEERRLVAITVPTDSSYYTLVYEVNGNDVSNTAHLLDTSIVEFFTKGDEILVHQIHKVDDFTPEYPDYGDPPQNAYTVPDDGNRSLFGHGQSTGLLSLFDTYYYEYYFILADGQRTDLGTVRRTEADGEVLEVSIGSVVADGSFGNYLKADYADYLAEKVRLTEGWHFVMGKEFDKADEFSTASDYFPVIESVDTAAGYILEALGGRRDDEPTTDTATNINEAAAMAIAEHYLPEHHRNHTDATGETMYVLAARQSDDCGIVLITNPEYDVTQYYTAVYAVNGGEAECINGSFASNSFRIYYNNEGILLYQAYVYEDENDKNYRSYEETYYTLINGKFTLVGELMHTYDNGERKNIYIADLSIDTSEGDTNRVESTYEEYLAQTALLTEGWTLVDSVEFPSDNSEAEGFRRIGDKEVVSGYILDALRKNDVSDIPAPSFFTLEAASRKAAELFLDVNGADGEDMLITSVSFGNEFYAVTLVPHVLRYDAHIFEIGSEVKPVQFNSLSMSVADTFELYTNGLELRVHYSGWLYQPQTGETEFNDYYYSIENGSLRLLGAVKRIENEETGEITSTFVHDESLPTTNGLGYSEVEYSVYTAEISRLTEGCTLLEKVELPHDGSVTEDFKPIGDVNTVAGYFLDALAAADAEGVPYEAADIPDSGEENDTPDTPEDSGAPSDIGELMPTATLSAATDEETYSAVARLFLQQQPQAEKLMVFGDHDDGYIGIAYKEGEYYTLHLFAKGNGIVSYVDTVKDVMEFSTYPDDVLHYKVRTILDGTDTVLNIYKKLKYVTDAGETDHYAVSSYGVTKKRIHDSNHVIGYYITDGTDLDSEFRSVNITEYNAMMQQTYQNNVIRSDPDVDLVNALYTFTMTQDESKIAKYLSDYIYYVTPENPGSTKPIDYPDDPCIYIDGEAIELECYAYYWHQSKYELDPFSMADNVPLENFDTVTINTFGSGKLIEAVCYDSDEVLPLKYGDVTGSGGDTDRAYEISLPKDRADKVYSITVEYSYGQLSYCFRILDAPGEDEEPGEVVSSDDFMQFGSGMYSPSVISDICIFDDDGEMQRSGGSYSFTDLDQLEYIGEYEQGSFYRINEYRVISVMPLGSAHFDSWYDWSFGEKLSEKYPKEWCYQVRYWDMLDEYSGSGEYVFQPPVLTLTDLDGKEYTIAADGDYDDVKLPAGVMKLTTKYGGHAESSLGKGVYHTDMKNSVILFNSDEEYNALIWVTYGDAHSYTYSFTVTPLEGDVSDQPPMLKMLVDGEEETLSRGSYSWLDINGNKLSGEAIPKTPLSVPYGAELQVQLENGAEIIYVTSLYNVDGEYVTNPDDYARHDKDGTLYISPDRIGSLITIAVRFPQGTCHYHFYVRPNDSALAEEFTAAGTEILQNSDTIADFKQQMQLNPLSYWLDEINIYKNNEDYTNGIEVTDGELTSGMIVRIVYNAQSSWVTIAK